MTLSKNKIDVINKSQTNPFYWRGQFTPDLVDYLLEEYGQYGNFVADPFSGSGTVLLSASKHGMPCLGIDVNPSAYYMSKFYEYSMLTLEERDELMHKIRTIFGQEIMAIPDDTPVYMDSAEYRKAYSNVLSLACKIKKLAIPELLPFMVNVLFLCEKDKKLTLKESLINNHKQDKNLSVCLAIFYSINKSMFRRCAKYRQNKQSED